MEGLSICIPVYNWDVTKLVAELHRQAEQLGVPFEILVADDCSIVCSEENKRALENLSGARYLLMETNLGRSRIRNYLTRAASYDWLLFMDCDVEVCSASFLADYWQARESVDLVVGGTTYHEEPPEPSYLLRWRYGMAVERRSAEERNKAPFQSFVPFNFLIRKRLLEQYPFDEHISKYGHEDTLLGWELKQHDVAILHIDNPLIHLGIDQTDEFLRKTRMAVENLLYIYQSDDMPAGVAESIHLLRFYDRLRRWHLEGVVRSLYRLTQRWVLRNLQGSDPNIHLFQWYKLGQFLELRVMN